MAQMTGDSANFDFGPCQVTFGGTDLGFFKGGVTVNYSIGYVELTADQTPLLIGNRVQTERITVTVPMAETDLDSLATVMPTGTKVVDAGGVKKKIMFGGSQVSESDALELVLTPLSDGSLTLSSDANEKITVHKAFPKPQFSKTYNLEGVRVVPVEFHGILDTTKAASNQLFLIGDSTATA